MEIAKYISDKYPVVGPFDGIRSIESKLLENSYLVVADNEKEFYGILTAADIIERPHKIVIDCIVKGEYLSFNETIISVMEKFSNPSYVALPVFKEDSFVGIIEKKRIICDYENKINDLHNKSLISNKVRTSFLNNLSHEIRTPLNGIIGFIEIIGNLSPGDLDKQKIHQIIRKSADRFLLIMNDLIELSLFNSGDEITITKEEVNIDEVLSELKDYFKELALLQNRQLTIEYIEPEHNQIIFTDKKRLNHILFHLIDNAVKFSDYKKVTFGYDLLKDKDFVEFFVTNESLHLSDEIKSKMFDFFEKQEIIGKELNPGLGIGLPMVKKTAEALGGNVRIEFIENEVLCFTSLPVK